MKILIATGGSDYSFMAVEKACQFVIDPANCEIRIISVYSDLAASSAEPMEITEEELDKIENIGRIQATESALHAEKIIKRAFPEFDISISMKAVRGFPAKEILNEAEKWRADLIVVGSLGHSFLSRMFLGSVSEDVVRKAKCSVLVVRGELKDVEADDRN